MSASQPQTLLTRSHSNDDTPNHRTLGWTSLAEASSSLANESSSTHMDLDDDNNRELSRAASSVFRTATSIAMSQEQHPRCSFDGTGAVSATAGTAAGTTKTNVACAAASPWRNHRGVGVADSSSTASSNGNSLCRAVSSWDEGTSTTLTTTGSSSSFVTRSSGLASNNNNNNSSSCNSSHRSQPQTLVGKRHTPVRQKTPSVKKGKLTPATSQRMSMRLRSSPYRLMPPSTPAADTASATSMATPFASPSHPHHHHESSLAMTTTTATGAAAASKVCVLDVRLLHPPTTTTFKRKKPKRSIGTVTTVASSHCGSVANTSALFGDSHTTNTSNGGGGGIQLDHDAHDHHPDDNDDDPQDHRDDESQALNDSVETHDTAANFRFTSFPASLPRIHPTTTTTTAKTILQEPQPWMTATRTTQTCPATVRKRMSFAGLADAATDLYGVPEQPPHNQQQQQQQAAPSHDDSYNTSMSSLHHDPDDSFHQQQQHARRHSNHAGGDNEDDDYHSARYIAEANNHHDDLHGGDGDEDGCTSVTRTRLNFGSVAGSPLLVGMEDLPPTDEFALPTTRGDLNNMPYEQHRSNQSCTSSMSSTAKNASTYNNNDETHQTASTAGTSLAEGPMHYQAPGTPQEVRMLFQLDATQCSPIPGIPEEEGECSSKSGIFTRPSHFRISASHGSRSTSSSGSSSGGRPMPDMNAFDGAGTHHNASHSSSSTTTRSASDEPTSPKLLCPPTPVRTPAWAHSQSKGHSMFPNDIRDGDMAHNSRGGGDHWHSKGDRLGRCNSLISTKVLATCSPHHIQNGLALPLTNPDTDRHHDCHTTNQTTCQTQGNKGDLDWLPQSETCSQQQQQAQQSSATTHPPVEVSMSTSFDIISTLGSGTFADVYKVRSKVDGRLYAVKRNRRQFRGRRDREAVLSEVRSMQRLQRPANSQTTVMRTTQKNSCPVSYSQYLLFFYQAWQEDGYFFCQTELCCRDTCREMMDAVRSQWHVAKTRYPCLLRLPIVRAVTSSEKQPGEDGRMLPDDIVWKVCHDVAAGLSHMHSHGLVHNDIKPGNILFEQHPSLGAMCKIGDFGMARDIGSSEDGQEGDQKYMALEQLESETSQPASDIFSLGLTLYEMASDTPFVIPSEGPLWHALRRGDHPLEMPSCRSNDIFQLVKRMMANQPGQRPTADAILANPKVDHGGQAQSVFLTDYINDAQAWAQCQEEHSTRFDDQTPRTERPLCSPPPPSSTHHRVPAPPFGLHSPQAAPS